MLPVSIVYSSVLIAIAVIDLKHQLILNKIVYPVAIVALIVNFFVPDLFSLHNFLFGLLRRRGRFSHSLFTRAYLQ